MENEILRRAAAYFAKETCRTQNDLHLHRPDLRRPACGGLLSGDGGVHLGFLCLAGRAGAPKDTVDAYLSDTIVDSGP